MSFRAILARFTRTAYVMDHRAAYGVMKPAAKSAGRSARSEHASRRSGPR